MKLFCSNLFELYKIFAKQNGPFKDDYLAFTDSYNLNIRQQSLKRMAADNSTKINNILKLMILVKENDK